MAIDSISNSAATSGSSSLNSSRVSIADNFDTFLSILTTQLKHQNPLEPLDTNQFTEQLVQFTSVEQQLKSNEFLEQLLAISQTSNGADAVAYIGKTITAAGAQSELQDGRATWNYSLDTSAENTIVTIRDAAGNTVFTEQGSLAAGNGQFVWDGVGSDGTRYASGSYSITIDARSASGAYIAVSTEIAGQVDGVDLSGAEPVLIVGGSRVALSSVTSVLAL